jgi:hypothetical protein
MCTQYLSENLSYRDHVGDLRVDESLIFNFIVKRCGVDWIILTQNGVQLWVWSGFVCVHLFFVVVILFCEVGLYDYSAVINRRSLAYLQLKGKR